jgi:ubiquinone/menaquinone biosynthesis C-methylase UbiE
MNNKRFNNSLGTSDYDIFKSVVYYYDDVQNNIAEETAKVVTDETKTILEIGSGSGITTLAVLKKIGDHVKIIAVDNEPKMIAQAKERLTDYKNRVELFTQEITAYLKTLPDNSIDGIYSGWVIHNIAPEQRTELFAEIGRVLKSGAFFVNGDKVAVDDEVEHKNHYDGYMKILAKLTELGRDDLRKEWTKHYEEDEIIKFTESEQQELLSKNLMTEPKIIFRELLDAVYVATKK